MKPSFNLLDRGWIPVVFPDGSIQELGIRETLEKAHELREISDPSPLEEYSVYRFLGLFLMDALRPRKKSSIRNLLREGKFDKEQIEKYIAQCQSEGVSFDLFDESKPFLQTSWGQDFKKDMKPVDVLDCTAPSGNNHTHFCHAGRERIQASEAARLLLNTYLFCTAAAQGYPSGVYGAPPLFSVIKGGNLFETLVSLLVPTDIIGIPFDDPPVLWRRTAPIQPKASIGSTSWLQGLLFPTRIVQLVPDEDGSVIGVCLSQGENYANKETWRDPGATYRTDKEGKPFPLRPHADAPIWRNVCDILDIPGEHASLILRLYQSLHPDETVHLTLYGAETNQASYLSVQRHDFSFPLRLAESERIELLSKCIEAAHRMYRALRRALSDVGVIPSASVSTALGNYDKACEERFWAMCDRAGDPLVDVREQYSSFCNDVCDSVLMTFDQTLAAIRLRAHKLALAEEKRDRLFFEANKLKKEANS